jgi:hypothetical protein
MRGGRVRAGAILSSRRTLRKLYSTVLEAIRWRPAAERKRGVAGAADAGLHTATQ